MNMLQSNLINNKTKTIKKITLSENCKHRVKPTLLRDVKTEALLVFSRTALERYFKNIEEIGWEPTVGADEDTMYVYSTLKELLLDLQEYVVNVDYLVEVSQHKTSSIELRQLAKHEEPLIAYYDVMAQKVANYFSKKPAYIPEFLVICVLSHWILEEEKSISLYPFLDKYDFSKLIDIFESNRNLFYKDSKCIISDIHNVSILIVEKLKQKKYKLNAKRVSKTRKKK